MKTSTEIASASRLVGMPKAVELIGKAGFDAWDLSLFDMARWDWAKNEPIIKPHPLNGSDYLRFVRELRNIGESYGMVCNQSHAPFPSEPKMPMDFIKRAIECTAEAGGQICIIHPRALSPLETNIEFYNNLLPFAKQYGVKIATENMWAWDREKDESAFAACATSKSFCEHIDSVNDPYLVACLDIGHAEMRGSGEGAAKMIRDLGPRLQALHIHDNDQWHDSHQIPFSMKIDFEEVVKALKDVGYSGYLTLEADNFLNAYTAENALDGVKKLHESAARLAEMME
jgi:sugar phosphate isomerase/epimerase